MTSRRGTAAAAVVDVLAAAGARLFFTVPGESFLEILDEVARRPELVLVSCRHESGAAFMAEAAAKLTGVPAVAMATRAVGASNLAIGVHTAKQDSTPMIVLLGHVETDRLGREAFQEVDLPRFYAELTVHAEVVHRSDQAGEAAARAWRAATSGRPGPAMLAFPADVLSGPCAPVPALAARNLAQAVAPSAVVARHVSELLRAAQRPVVIAGRGAQLDPEPVRRLVEHFALGVHTAFRRQDAFPNSHPLHLGHLGLSTPEPLLQALRAADLVLVLGSRLSEPTTQGYALPLPSARIVQVDPDPRVAGALPIACAVGPFVDAVLAADDGAPVERDWSAAHGHWQTVATLPPEACDGVGRPPGAVHPAAVVAAVRRHVPHDAVIANDAGNFAAFLHRHWVYDDPHSQLGPTSGAMGYAVPAAIGAALAAPDRRAVALVGDGGFLMTGQELETAARHALPIVVIVFQNRLYGTIAMHQARSSGRLAGVGIGDVDLAGFARSLGATAVTVDAAADLDDVLAAAFEPAAGPHVVVVRTDPDAIAPGTSLASLVAASTADAEPEPLG